MAQPAIIASNVDKNKRNAQDPQVDAFLANTCESEWERAGKPSKFSISLGKFRLVLEKALLSPHRLAIFISATVSAASQANFFSLL